MNRKKLFTLILTGIMAVALLVGCGSDTNGNSEDSTSVDIQSEENESDTEDTQNAANAEEGASAGDAENAGEAEDAAGNGKALVVYYSASGNTERVADIIADAAGADLFEVEPAEPYSADDLDWTNEDSRVSVEHDNENERDVELVSATVGNWDSYETVYIGYPIWWGIAAWPLDGFVKANDFTGKTVIPFCTSSSSDIGESGELLAQMAGNGEWQEGKRFQSSVSEEDVRSWVGEVN